MTKRGDGPRILSVVILIATAIVVFAVIGPVIGDSWIAAILACLSVLPFASSLLAESGPPARRRLRS